MEEGKAFFLDVPLFLYTYKIHVHIIFHRYFSFPNSCFRMHFVDASYWLGIHTWLKKKFRS